MTDECECELQMRNIHTVRNDNTANSDALPPSFLKACTLDIVEILDIVYIVHIGYCEYQEQIIRRTLLMWSRCSFNVHIPHICPFLGNITLFEFVKGHQKGRKFVTKCPKTAKTGPN